MRGLAVAIALAACGDHREAVVAAPVPVPVPIAIAARPHVENATAYLPVQCYATTHVDGGRTRNPCATCHRDSQAPNFVDDADVQLALSLPAAATTNPWTNAVSPPPPVAIDDAALLAWVRTPDLDVTATDCAFAPDADGWDRDARGIVTGWRAFSYTPTPGMFWPTNGSAGDAFIRLPEAYRRTEAGAPDPAVYAVNLAIVEAAVRRVDVPIAPTDERALGVDLDGDGRLGTARRVAFAWPPKPGHEPSYVGQARTLDRAIAGWPAAGLFPTGTELVHSLRYLDVVDGRVRPGARMKEIRYLQKARWLTYSELDLAAKAEQREKMQDPDRVRLILGDAERGVGTGGGWLLRGYIETAEGTLRTQTLDETAACIGCHGGVGASTDNTFSFARKTAWGVRGFLTMPEPTGADGRGEYRTWLLAVGAGDDFGTNDEVARKFFTPAGTLRPAMVAALARDISVLVVPSPERALALDRAYLAIVRAQSFAHGRDAFTGKPAVEARLTQGAPTGIAHVLAQRAR